MSLFHYSLFPISSLLTPLFPIPYFLFPASLFIHFLDHAFILLPVEPIIDDVKCSHIFDIVVVEVFCLESFSIDCTQDLGLVQLPLVVEVLVFVLEQLGLQSLHGLPLLVHGARGVLQVGDVDLEQVFEVFLSPDLRYNVFHLCLHLFNLCFACKLVVQHHFVGFHMNVRIKLQMLVLELMVDVLSQ